MNSPSASNRPGTPTKQVVYHAPSNDQVSRYAEDVCVALATSLDSSFKDQGVAEGFAAFLHEFGLSYAAHISSAPISNEGESFAA